MSHRLAEAVDGKLNKAVAQKVDEAVERRLEAILETKFEALNGQFEKTIERTRQRLVSRPPASGSAPELQSVAADCRQSMATAVRAAARASALLDECSERMNLEAANRQTNMDEFQRAAMEKVAAQWTDKSLEEKVRKILEKPVEEDGSDTE